MTECAHSAGISAPNLSSKRMLQRVPLSISRASTWGTANPLMVTWYEIRLGRYSSIAGVLLKGGAEIIDSQHYAIAFRGIGVSHRTFDYQFPMQDLSRPCLEGSVLGFGGLG